MSSGPQIQGCGPKPHHTAPLRAPPSGRKALRHRQKCPLLLLVPKAPFPAARTQPPRLPSSPPSVPTEQQSRPDSPTVPRGGLFPSHFMKDLEPCPSHRLSPERRGKTWRLLSNENPRRPSCLLYTLQGLAPAGIVHVMGIPFNPGSHCPGPWGERLTSGDGRRRRKAALGSVQSHSAQTAWNSLNWLPGSGHFLKTTVCLGRDIVLTLLEAQRLGSKMMFVCYFVNGAFVLF